MKFAHLLLTPPKVKITQEEILADLLYPASASKRPERKRG